MSYGFPGMAYPGHRRLARGTALVSDTLTDTEPAHGAGMNGIGYANMPATGNA